MALRDQPYLPLYVQDYLTDEKLNMCTAASQGVYIKLMCLFHKSESYGGILLKQKDKQKESITFNFANKLAKLISFDLLTIESAIIELLDEKVLTIEGDFLFQKRMVKDNELSIIRSEIGRKGGVKTQDKNKKFAKAKVKANTENEIVIKSEDVIVIKNKEKYQDFILEFNRVRNSKFSDKDQKAKRQFEQRIKDGFTIDNIIFATEQAMKDPFHIENAMKYLTPEFITRSEKLEKFLNFRPENVLAQKKESVAQHNQRFMDEALRKLELERNQTK